MTGLYKNIRALQNNRSQTFLKRAPRIVLGALSKTRIAQKYQEVFSLNPTEADEMAKNYGITKEELLKAYGSDEVVKYDMKMHRALEILKEVNEK